MKTAEYKRVWLAFVQIEPEENYSFKDLIESEEEVEEIFIGAWANILIKAKTINDAISIIPEGLKEKKFDVIFIDKIENVQSLVEYEELDLEVKQEIDWLLSTDFVFMISDKIFPYAE